MVTTNSPALMKSISRIKVRPRTRLKGLNQDRGGLKARQGKRGGDGGADGSKVAEETPQMCRLHTQICLRGHCCTELLQAGLQIQALQ